MTKWIIILLMPFTASSQSGIEIIKTSASKIKSLKNISYNIYEENPGEKITADVTIERNKKLPVFDAKLRVSGIAITADGSRPINFSYDGQSFEFTDIKTNTVTKLDSPSYAKLSRTGMMIYTLLALAPYCQKEPFDNILKQLKNAEKLADTAIYNVPCFAVKVSMEVNSELMGKQLLESTWYFDKEKFLICGNKSSRGIQLIKIREIDKKLNDDFFSLTTANDVKKITGLEPIGEGLLEIGSIAPDWTLPSSLNKQISLKELKGKVVLLDFWGTWCLPCLKAMPEVQAIHEKFKNSPVVVLGVSVEMEKHADPIAYMKKKGYSYTTLLDGQKITKRYKVHEFPSVYIIDINGFIIHAEHGGNRENFKEDMIERVNKALRNSD